MSNFEGFKSRRTDLGLYTTPPDSWRHGDFSSVTTPLYDPLTRTVGPDGKVTATLFPGNHIDPARFDPISLKLLEFWPLPNLNTLTVSNNFQNPQKTTIDKNQFNQRIDFNESSKSNWFFRYSWSSESLTTAAVFPSDNAITPTDVCPTPSSRSTPGQARAIFMRAWPITSPMDNSSRPEISIFAAV